MVTDKDGFYTMKGYERSASDEMTSSMEDYLEMVCRMEEEGEPIRVSSLAASLHVRPSSASKMVSNLREKGLVTAEKYGEIHLTDSGRAFGQYLLYRHDLLHQFLCFLNHSQNELEQVEKIEHFVDEKTVRSIQAFLDGLTRESRA